MVYKIIAIFLSSIFFLFFSCKQGGRGNRCQYKLNDLLSLEAPSVSSKILDDTIIEATDNVGDFISFGRGFYTFDKKENLRFYAFFQNESHYRYSEEYDSVGNLIKKEGTPLVEYRLWRKENDSILFNVSLFALNKKYLNIEVVTNKGDTIRPNYLFKSSIYSNVKCFAFKLKMNNGVRDLICYTRIEVQNTCTSKKYFFRDTTDFVDVRIN